MLLQQTNRRTHPPISKMVSFCVISKNNPTLSIENPADSLTVMEVDSGSKPAKKATGKKRVQKRVNKIVFPKYGEKKISKKRYSK